MAKILLVDDDKFLRQLYTDILTGEGHAVTSVETGNDFLKKAQNENWDLLLLDIMLPDTDGLTVARSLQEDPHKASIPLVFLTNLDKSEDLAAAEKLSKGYIIKSQVTPDQFIEQINTYLSK